MSLWLNLNSGITATQASQVQMHFAKNNNIIHIQDIYSVYEVCGIEINEKMYSMYVLLCH